MTSPLVAPWLLATLTTPAQHSLQTEPQLPNATILLPTRDDESAVGGGDRGKALFASSFTLYSPPIELRYGQVMNYVDNPSHRLAIFQPPSLEPGAIAGPLPLPKDVVARYADPTRRQMAVRNFSFDIVRIHPDGSESGVPVSELYPHHFKVRFQSPNRTVIRGSFPASTAFEYRATDFGLQMPFRKIYAAPTTWWPYLHAINTRDPSTHTHGFSMLHECPCAYQDIDLANNTVNGLARDGNDFVSCDADISSSTGTMKDNPSCSLATIRGGIICCTVRGSFLTNVTACAQPGCAELPLDRAYLKVTVDYEDATPQMRHVEGIGFGTIAHPGMGEFTLVPCAAGTPTDDCIFRVEAVSPIVTEEQFRSMYPWMEWDPNELIEVTQMVPHLHAGGLSLEVQDALTNQTVCRTSVANGGIIYGRNDARGDERGYIIGSRPCTWDGENALRFARSHPVRTIAIYNAAKQVDGAMGMFFTMGTWASLTRDPDQIRLEREGVGQSL
jgi:hypothetical protein